MVWVGDVREGKCPGGMSDTLAINTDRKVSPIVNIRVYLPRKLFHDPETRSTSPVKNSPVRISDTIRNIKPGLKTATNDNS